MSQSPFHDFFAVRPLSLQHQWSVKLEIDSNGWCERKRARTGEGGGWPLPDEWVRAQSTQGPTPALWCKRIILTWWKTNTVAEPVCFCNWGSLSYTYRVVLHAKGTSEWDCTLVKYSRLGRMRFMKNAGGAVHLQINQDSDISTKHH